MRGRAIALGAAALFIAALWTAARHAGAEPKGGSKAAGKESRKAPAAPVNLRGAPIQDLPTTVSVPVSDERSLVLSLRPGFWLRCPRYSPVPTSLDGRGLILQYLNARGGSVSLLYVGTVPLGSSEAGGDAKERAASAAADFSAMLAEKYQRIDWILKGGPPALRPVSVKLNGKKTSAWRTEHYRTQPRDYAGPDSTFTGECLLFQPEGTDVLAYVALDFKGGGTTLDAVIDGMQLKPTRGLHAKGRRIQLNDLRASDDGRYPVRLMAFDLPAGFAPTPALWELGGEWVYVEERLPPGKGASDAVLRIAGRPAGKTETVADAAQAYYGLWPEAGRTPIEQVGLSVAGHQAHLFSHASPAEGDVALVHTALVLLDDQMLTLTWVSSAGGEQAQRDHAQFVALLKSIEMAVRW